MATNMKKLTSKPDDRDRDGIPYGGGSRIGSCGDCGGHVMAGGGHPVPLPPKCADCGATVRQPLAMNKAKAPPAKKGFLPKKRSNAVAPPAGEY